MNQPTLCTERLVLRKPMPSDAAAMRKELKDPHIPKVTRIPVRYTLSLAKDFIKRARKKEPEAIVYFITLDKKLIGCVGIHPSKKDNTAELGYWLAKNYRRQGYGTEALTAVISYGFLALKLTKIGVGHMKGNTASMKLIKKMGFKKDGVLRQHIRSGDGKQHDEVIYSLLPKEWKR